MKTKLVQIKLQETLWNQLKKKAEDEERSLSSLIRIIVKEYLKKEDDWKNAVIDFECKICNWKSFPGATILCNKTKTEYYCPKCEHILNVKIEVTEQAFILKKTKRNKT